jgi:cbb3-type cytochrome oxidase maturation protein
MAVIYILLPLAVLLASLALFAFVRAAKAGQFDDLDTPAHRILHDDEPDRMTNGPAEIPDSTRTPSTRA